ncbi:programmed cell death protein 2-like [Salarias fasciatus]|uniref:Programmed cell death protein 2 C-terminal domain-containing protein n=1 Tax=Salarias fasciatus TaxID=181472 RepID=A0A672FEM7_SALFA|nr:programmed cell death protein 2-like [Salarias fasciatus]
MSVLLGLADGDLDPARHRSSFLTNKAGGVPDWQPGQRGLRPACRRCGAASALVVQVYCPVDRTPTHRNLHLFACTAPACSGLSEAWTALRSQGAAEDRPGRARGPADPGPGPGPEPVPRVTDWCDGADDWGLEEEEEEEEEEAAGPAVKEEPERPAGSETDVSGRLQDLQLEDRREDAAAAAVFRPLFISVVEEADLGVEDGALDHVQELLREYESREGAVQEEQQGGGGGGAGGGVQEEYEKAQARHGDRVFGGFMKRIAPCPQQILRYSHGGRPLFVSSPPAAASRLAPPCGSCGAARTFELQLMPALVSLLRRADRGGGGELEFGTVLVYTCSGSCWAPGSNSALEEVCFVQADPDQQLFR